MNYSIKKCFNCKSRCQTCTGVHVLSAIDFYNSNPRKGDIVKVRRSGIEMIFEFFDGEGRVLASRDVFTHIPGRMPCGFILLRHMNQSGKWSHGEYK